MRAAWYVPEVNERRAGLRYRCTYPIAALQRRGINAALFDEKNAELYDAVTFDAWTLFPTVTSEVAAERALALAERLKANGTRIILDNCDNQFSGSPDQNWRDACNRLRRLANQANTVITCSDELASVMQAECGLTRTPLVIGDPIETRIRYTSDSLLRSIASPGRKLSWFRYIRHRAQITIERSQGISPLVWFGGHGNSFSEGGMLDLKRVVPILSAMSQEHPVSLTVISNNRSKFESHFSDLPFSTHYIEWDRVNFLAMLRLHAISLIPIALNEFTRCKSANRLTLSLYHGLNVVADAIPSYRDFANVCALDDWHGGLRKYLANPGLRNRHKADGKALALAKFDIDRIADAWVAALNHASPSARERQ